MWIKRRERVVYLKASDIALMGTCEHKALLERQLGRRVTAAQAIRIERGTAEHRAFYRDGVRAREVAPEAKRWCFIATAVYGPAAPETNTLRAFRDHVLRRFAMGRHLVAAYYATSPALAEWLEDKPVVRTAVRMAMRPVVAACGNILRARRKP
jgi:hypothetical protein